MGLWPDFCAAAGTARLRPMTPGRGPIAIIEDDESVSRALARVVRSLGYEVGLFPSGEAFLRAEPERAPAAMLLDLHLPGLQGAPLIARLRALAPGARIIVMTGRDSPGAREACLAAGAAAYVRKPMPRATLDALLTGA